MDGYSVLMTVYKKDSPEFFLQSVSSMLNQTIKTDDFVLVCDGEITDELEQAIKIAFKGNERILNLVRLPKNEGLGEALRVGVPLCKNALIARMDDDDLAKSFRCERELIEFEKDNELAICGSYMNEFESSPSTILREKKVPLSHDEILRFSRRRNPFNHSTVMFKKDEILRVGNYSGMRTNQDVDLWVRALNNGVKGKNIDVPLVDFRFGNDTYRRRKNWKNVKLLLNVWKGFVQAHYCSLWDYCYVLVVQIAVFLMPTAILKWSYDHFR